MERFLSGVAKMFGEQMASAEFNWPTFIGGVVTALLGTWIF